MTAHGSSSDPNQERVYAWERAYVDERLTPSILSSEQCFSFIWSIASHLAIPMPRITFTQGGACFATSSWAISLADWGRTHQTILHEMAHLATFDKVMAGEAGHGPSFVLTVIDLYSTFLGFDADELTIAAVEVGILGSEHLPMRKSPRNEDPFFAGEF